MRLCRGFTMAINIIHYILLVFWTIQLVVCDERSSLTFVIDDTASMSDDIAQVMKGANDIFDTVMNSNTSKIENYILVTFNDPKKMLRTITKDRKRFKHDLSSISVHGGGDCPEMSMSGIELALENSLPGSYLYVFTDASAKDYYNFERVKTLSQKKQCQVVFVLTGICGKPSSPDYLVYHELAKATSGQVFHLDKDEVKKILAYVTETVKSKRVTIASKEFKPGYGNNITFGVDNQMKGVMLSVSGSGATVDVTGPDGSKPSTRNIVRTTHIAVVKVEDTKPGLHTATVGSRSNTAAVISAETSVDFKIGFSAFQPSNIKETATRPLPDEKSYLSVKLIIEKSNVELKTVQILDMEGNVILEKPVVLVEEKGLFYVATEPVVPPNEMFKVAIQCYDVENKTPITRISSTSIEPQKTWTNKVTNKEPEVLIEGINPFISKIKLKYGELLELKCKVNAYPKPGVIWQDDTGSILPSKTFAIELPYDYISVLKVDNAKNNTYKCKASNILGESNSEVEIEVETFFNIVERPKDTIIEFTKEGHLTCKVEASPSANVTWYKNDKQIHEDSDYAISEDGSVLKITNMHLSLRGFYKCRIKNALREEFLTAEVKISGLALPEIDKNTTIVKTQLGSDTIITCSIVKGTPKPKIRWFFNGAPLAFKRNVEASETMEELYLMDVSEDTAGTYRCVAMNTVGRDTHKTVLIVEMSEHPSILEVGKMMIVKSGERITLPCTVTGTPTPAVRWLANGTAILDQRHEFYENSLSFVPTQHDSGDYTCIAENKMGTASTTIQIEVFVPVTIKVPRKSSITVIVGNNVELDCKADGYPKPEISWRAYIGGRVFNVSSSPTGSKKLQNMQFQQEGLYVCTASNKYNSINITYDVKVIVPAKILRRRTNFDGIVGDPLLMIPCVAEGRPKPKITWFKDGSCLASSTTKYNIEADGTLQIFNIDDGSTGLYECEAKNNNNMYEDKMTFKVMVHPYTFHQHNTSRIVLVEEGKPLHLECEASKTSTDIIRWYNKYGQLISTRTVEFEEASTSDTGRYTCRVFKDGKHHMGDHAVFVKVGSKPLFKTNVKLDLDLAPKTETYLNCEAVGTPAPMVKWRHNDEKTILALTPYYITKEPGEYHCSVSNEFGAINRTFKISLRQCLLDIRSDFNTRAPLILESSLLTQPDFEICNDYMRIPSGRTVSLHCPISAGFEHFNTSMIHATCYRKTEFKIQEKIFNFSQLKCKKNWKSTTRESPQKTCMKTGNYLVEMGYSTRGGFLAVYKICYNKKERLPFYALKDMKQMTCSDTKIPRNNVSPVSSPREEWYSESLMPYLFDDMYSCTMQNSSNTMDFKKWFGVSRGSCSIGKRQLLHPRHLTGLPQGIAYSYLNVVPQLKQYMDNWDDVERRVELRRKEVPRLRMFSGGLYHIPGESRTRNSYIIDKYNRRLPVPIYLWKIVDVIAIVQINVPKLTKSELRRYIFCDDLCDKNPWTRNTAWRNINNGYIFCCDRNEFLDATGLR